MDLGNLKTDQKLENEGVWADLDSTSQVKVISTTSRSYRKVAKKKMLPFQRIISGAGINAIPDEEQEAITIATLVDGVLLDWRSKDPESEEENKEKWPHVLYLDGEAIDYSREAAQKLLTEIPRFRTIIADLAGSIETFRSVALETTEKN